MRVLVGIALVFGVMFRSVAATKTKVFDSLCMTQETQCALLGYALATDDDCLRAEFLEHAQALQELIDEGQDLWEETRLAGRARLTRHGANGDDLKLLLQTATSPGLTQCSKEAVRLRGRIWHFSGQHTLCSTTCAPLLR